MKKHYEVAKVGGDPDETWNLAWELNRELARIQSAPRNTVERIDLVEIKAWSASLQRNEKCPQYIIVYYYEETEAKWPVEEKGMFE